MTYIVWYADGTAEDIVTDEPMSLEKMQELVGGYIEMATRKDDLSDHMLVFNEEGIIIGLPVNQKFPYIVGNVIEGKMADGEDGREFVGF